MGQIAFFFMEEQDKEVAAFENTELYWSLSLV